MDLLKINFLQQGFFRQAKYMIAAPGNSQPVFLLREAGNVSRELLTLNTGYITAKDERKSWLVHHKLKLSVLVGDNLQDEQVLIITERSYIPEDPFNRISESDKQTITPLKEIARLRHADKMANAGDQKDMDARNRLLSMVTTSCLVLIGIMAVLKLITG